jgi:hypothetical protein
MRNGAVTNDVGLAPTVPLGLTVMRDEDPEALSPLVARARELLVDAVDATSALDRGILVPYGNKASFATVGLAMRSRRLAMSILTLCDAGSWLEAQILVRSLLDYVITLEWILLDPEVRVYSWWQADDRSFDTVVREVTEQISLPIELSVDEEQARRDLIARIAKDAEEVGAPAYPPLQQRAQEVSSSLAYSLFFRLYSQGGAHPYRMSILALLRDVPERRAALILGEPDRQPVDDPYYLTGVLMIVVHRRLAEKEAGLGLPSVVPLEARLAELKSELDQAA